MWLQLLSCATHPFRPAVHGCCHEKRSEADDSKSRLDPRSARATKPILSGIAALQHRSSSMQDAATCIRLEEGASDSDRSSAAAAKKHTIGGCRHRSRGAQQRVSSSRFPAGYLSAPTEHPANAQGCRKAGEHG